MFQLEFTRRYSAAHRFINSLSAPCQVPHGHNWQVTLCVEAGAPRALDGDVNMVVEFKTAKARWHGWIDTHVDHTLQLNAADPLIAYFRDHEPQTLKRILVTPGDPTTEMLAALFQAKAQAFMDAEETGLVVTRVRLEETPTNAVILSGARAFEAHLPARAAEPQWWYGADGRISHLEPPSQT